ncbi:MAG: putative Ig domain-containing protein [Bacteroidota bacterium]|jgi:hypothetical protein
MMIHKLRNLSVLMFLVISSLSVYAQNIPNDSLYFGQTPPGDSAIVFAPGIVSITGRTENRITFSPDRKMCFFSAMGGPVLFLEYKNEAWTTPYTLNSKFKSEPFFFLDGKRVYLNSRAALNQVGGCDLSYSERIDTSWSDPVSLGNPPNLPEEQYHPCIVADSSIYFSSGAGDICRSQYKNGAYQQRVILPYPINNANTSQTWGDPYVAPDESYLIFRSTRNGGYGGNDIYISYKKANGSWTNPKNLGDKINTSNDELSGDVTPDGKYMTFGRNSDIYWVSSSFIDSLKHTNFIPYVERTIPNQVVNRDSLFSFQIPDSVFIDDDGNNTLSYTATSMNGSPLPAWLSFNSVTRTFSGTPDTAAVFNIKVIATDTANTSASGTFKITISNPTGVKEDKNQFPNMFELNQNYPNPFNPTTSISFFVGMYSQTSLRVYDMLGREVAALVNEKKLAGSYAVQWNAAGMPSGIYFYKLQAGKYTETKKLVLLK